MDPVVDSRAPNYLISLSDFVDAEADMGCLDELLKYGVDGPTAAETTMPWDFLDFRSGEEAEDKDVEPMDMAKVYSGQRRSRDVEGTIQDEELARKNAVKARLSMDAPIPGSHLEQDATRREGMNPNKEIVEFEAWTALQSNLKEKVIREIDTLISESGRDKVQKLTGTAEEILRRLLPLRNVSEKNANASHLPSLEESLRILFERQNALLSNALGGQDLVTIVGAMSQSIKEGQRLVDKLGNIVVCLSKKLRQLVQGLKFRENNMDKLLLKCSSNIPELVETFLKKQRTSFISVASKPEDRPQKRQAARPIMLQTTGNTNDSLRRESSLIAIERKYGNWDGYDIMPCTGVSNHIHDGSCKSINPSDSVDVPTIIRDLSLAIDGAGGAPRGHDSHTDSSARTDRQEKQHQRHPEKPETPSCKDRLCASDAQEAPEKPETPSRNDRLCASDAQEPGAGDSTRPGREGKNMDIAVQDERATLLDHMGCSDYPTTGQTWKRRWRCWFRTVHLFLGRRKERWVVNFPERGTMSAPVSARSSARGTTNMD